MSQALFFLIVGLGFYQGGSVSFVERSDAIWSNPAGRAMHYDGVELHTKGYYQDDVLDYQIGLSAGLLGFGYRWQDSTRAVTTGIGIPLGKRFRIGGAYYWGDNRFWRFGLQANPLNWLALGGMIETGDTLGATLGLGIRPFTDRVTLFSDLSYRGGIQSLEVGLGVEPISGITLSTAFTQPFEEGQGSTLEFGLQLAFGNVKLRGFGITYSPEGLGGGLDLSFSFPRYPSIRFSKPGPKVIEWAPKGRSESPEASGFKFSFISLSAKKSKTFYDLLTELRSLGKRKDVKGILLDFREASLSTYQLEEVRTELEALKEKGLKIVAFSEGYTLGSYYLASVSDKIWMVPTGDMFFVGGYARTLHIKGTLDKLGIEPDFYRVGEYKSAYELVEFSETSKEDKEQLEAYLSSVYDVILSAVEKDRGMESGELEKIINENPIISGDSAKSLGLVDNLCLAQELDSLLKEEFGEKINRTKFADLSKESREVPRAWVDNEKQSTLPGRGKIALVVAEGSIVTGKSSNNPLPIPLFGGKQMGSTTISEVLKNVKDDKQIKAVVFRINSGGGSALASEIINRALTELSDAKPVVVSMAGVAGSGGYYIAAPGNKIFADATTLTGSIGILGGKFVTEGFDQKVGINRETVKLFPHADMFSPDRPFDEQEAKIMQELMDEGYAEFVNRVAEGRNMTFDEVDSVARGRIWSGTDGVNVGLVDEVGGLLAAVNEARKNANLPEDCDVVIYPKPEPMVDLSKALDEASLLNLKLLPSWLYENMLYLVPYQIELNFE